MIMVNDEAILKDVFDIIEQDGDSEETEVSEEAVKEPTDETEKTEEATEGEPVEPTEEVEKEGKDVDNYEKEEEPTEEKTEEVPETPVIDEDIINTLKEIDPEVEVKDQKEAISTIKARYDELKETVGAYEKNNKDIIKAFEENPSVMDFMKAVISGMNPMTAAGIYISETLAPEDGETGDEEYKAEVSKRKAEKEKSAKALEDFKANHKASAKRAEEFLKENKLDQVEFEKQLSEFDKQIAELQKGVITKDLLSIVHKANQYDKELKAAEKKIKEAEERGYLRGKNEKIVLKKTSKENTDGMPGLTSGSGKEREGSQPDWLDKISSRRGSY